MPNKTFMPGDVISEGTLRNQDLLRAFHDALYFVDSKAALAIESRKRIDRIIDMHRTGKHFALNDHEIEAGWIIEELQDSLNELAPDGCRFGAHEGDRACFGFWYNPE